MLFRESWIVDVCLDLFMVMVLLSSLCVYAHMIRCLLHGSPSSRVSVWTVGVLIWLFLCGACFTGYSLVYGQMSLWAIVVICSLVTAVPVVGVQIFGIHFILPLVLTCLVMVHLILLLWGCCYGGF